MKTLSLGKPVLLLLFTLLLIALLYVGQTFLIPVGYALLLSIAMTPLARKFEQWGMGRGLAVTLCVILLLLLVVGIISVLSFRMVSLVQDFNDLQDQIFKRFDKVEAYITKLTHWSQERQVTYLKSQTSIILGTVSTYMQSLLTSAALSLVEFGLVLFYTFCLMYYRERFEQFILRIVPRKEQDTAKSVETEISNMTYQYLSGRLLVLLIQAAIYYVGFLLVDGPYPLFFAVLGGILNIVPYIGALVAGLLPLVLTLLTGSLFNVLGVAGVALANHLFESNYLTPKIVGAKIKINPLFTVFTVVIGELIWGIAGMILFIPMLGVVKIVCDSITELKPYGMLIGDESISEKKMIKKEKKERVET